MVAGTAAWFSRLIVFPLVGGWNVTSTHRIPIFGILRKRNPPVFCQTESADAPMDASSSWRLPETRYTFDSEANDMADSGSTVARRALGRELRRLLLAANMLQSEAGRFAEVSPQSIGRIEEGRATRTTGLQVNALCDGYGATDAERRVLLGLVN